MASNFYGPGALTLTLLLTLTSICHSAITMRQPHHCATLTGVWEVTRPGQNYSEYFRIRHDADTIVFQSHSENELPFGQKVESTEYSNSVSVSRREFILQINDVTKDCVVVLKDKSVWKQVEDVKKVQVIFMNHLDVGYNTNQFYPGTKIKIPGYVFNVLNWYFQVYFPRAVKLAQELRDMKRNETFIYTTHPWLVNLYLDCPKLTLSGIKLQCPSAEQLESFRLAVWKGDITWHAGPLNQEAEASNPELFTYSLTLSKRLDNQFGIKREARTLSQRDVPGMTKAAIPFILQQGISAISVGCNAASAPPDMPSPNIWKFGKHEILTYWHKGGYPLPTGPSPQDPGGLKRSDCQFVKGLDHVLCFAFRADNLGPPVDVNEILMDYKILRYEFPGSVIQATKFEDFTKLLLPLKSTFPVIETEVGDTWIQGPQSDPVKMIKFRAINRLRSNCVKQKECSVKDKRFYDFSRFLVKLPEHTYGIASDFDNVHWNNDQFWPLQYQKSSFKNVTTSLLGHRAFNDIALAALQKHPLASQIRNEFKKLKPYVPDLKDYKSIPLNQSIYCSNGLKMTFGSHGGLDELVDKNGILRATKDSPLAKILYRTYSSVDYQKMFNQYRYYRMGAIFKPNYEKSHAESKFWDVEVHNIYVPKTGDPCSQGIYTRILHKDMQTWWKYGAPTEYFLKYTTSVGQDLEIEYQFFNKPSTKMVEALFLSFETGPSRAHKWYVNKLGSWIDPTNVVLNGSQYVHGVGDFGVGYLDSKGKGMMIESPDVLTVSVLTPDRPADMLPIPLAPMKTKPNGVAFNIYNNIWDTNFVFWYPFEPQDKHFKARFRITFNDQ